MSDSRQAAANAATDRAIESARRKAPDVRVKKGKELLTVRRIGLVGDSGEGKTHFLLGPILAGENVLVLSTDLGGNGLATIEGALKEIGEEERFEKQVRGVDVHAVSAVEGYTAGAYDDQILEGGWSPTVEVWDGFSTYNNVTVDRAVHDPNQDKFAHFAGVLRKTMYPLELFLGREVPRGSGNVPHKIVTMAEDDVRDDKGNPTGVIKPMIAGKSVKLSKLGFDLVMYLYSKREKNKDTKEVETKYFYRTGGPNTIPTKSRHFKDLPDLFVADPSKVWEILTGKKREGKE